MENIQEMLNKNLEVQNVPVNLTKKNKKTNKPMTAKEEEIEKLRIAMREKVRGIFHFFECPQGTLSFNYKEFENDPLERFDMIDGQIREIPLGVAKHLNRSGKYNIYKHVKDQDGKVTMKVGQKISRYSFESLEFKDIELNNELN